MPSNALVGPGRNNDPNPLRQLVQQIQDLRRYVDDKSAQILRTAGLRAEPDLLRVLGSLVVEGSETISGSLDVTGPMTVGGTLSLPAGIIGNDALANPVAFAGNKGSVNAVLPPSSYGTAGTANLTIPSWAGSVVVLATASISATSSGSPGGAVIGDIIIDGAAGDSDVINLASGATGNFTVLAQRTYTATPPTISVSLSWFRQNAIASAGARLIAIAVVGR